MTTYTLKLVSGVDYNLYEGTTLVSDSDLTTLFGNAGEAYFVFDFNSGTPTNTTDLTIVDSNSQAVITNTGLSGIAENVNFKGEWSASATAFDSFVKLGGVAMDEAQLSDLMGKIKNMGGGTYEEVELVRPSSGAITMDDFLTASGKAYPFSGTFVVTIATGSSGYTTLDGTAVASTQSSLVSRQFVLIMRAGSATDIEWFFIPRQFAATNVNIFYQMYYRIRSGNSMTIQRVLTSDQLVTSLTTSAASSSSFGLAASAGKGLRDLIYATTANSPLAWTTIGTASAYTKRALQVTVKISETSLTLTADDWNTLFTLPSGFRPTVVMEGAVSVLDSGVIETSYAKVNTDGTVQVRAFGSTTEVHGSIVFPVSS